MKRVSQISDSPWPGTLISRGRQAVSGDATPCRAPRGTVHNRHAPLPTAAAHVVGHARLSRLCFISREVASAHLQSSAPTHHQPRTPAKTHHLTMKRGHEQPQREPRAAMALVLCRWVKWFNPKVAVLLDEFVRGRTEATNSKLGRNADTGVCPCISHQPTRALSLRLRLFSTRMITGTA